MFNVVVVLIVLVSIVKGQTDPCSPGGHKAIPNIGFRFVNYRLDATDVLFHDYRLPSGWYYAGNVTMPEHPPDDIFTCGTKFPVWLNGSHPTNSTPVSARACQMGVRNTCGVSYNIKIQRCTGFYVYQLTKTTSLSVGYCFGIGATGAPPKFVPSKPRVKPGVKDGGYFGKTPITETVFSCIFEESKTEKLQFIVSWYMNQRFMYRTEYRDSPSDAALQLTEDEFNRHGFRLGTNISCSVRAFIKRDSAPGKSSDCADDFFAGIRVLSEYLTFEADEMDESKRSIRLYATVPIGCVGKICYIELEANVPDNGTCTSIAFNAMCGVQIESNTYNQTLNLPIKYVENGRYFTGVLHKIFLKTVNTSDNRIWSNYALPPIKIRIRPSAKFNVYEGKKCSSLNDPHITTFDGRRYDNQQEGVYIMYRNTNYSAEVQTKYQNCYKGNEKIKCNCGVAVKAGRDLFEFNICNDKTFIGHRFCSDKVLVVKSLGEKKYKIFLPYGTYIETSMSLGLINIQIIPSSNDQGAVLGLCGNLDENPNNDLRNRKGNGTPDLPHFKNIWKVHSEAENLFSPNVNKSSFLPWAVDVCLCTNKSGSRDSTVAVDKGIHCETNAVASCTIGKTMGIHSCYDTKHRRRRSVDRNPIIPTVVMRSRRIQKRDTTSTSMTIDKAKQYCQEHIGSSPVFSLCSKVPSVNPNSSLDTCIADIMLSGTVEWTQGTKEAMQDTCLSELRRNTTLRQTSGNKTSIAEEIENLACPNNCSSIGLCKKGKCSCAAGYGGSDCSIDITKGPTISGLLDHGMCDEKDMPCDHAYVFGSIFTDSKNLSCRLEEFSISANGSRQKSKVHFIDAEFESLVEVMCPLSHTRRKRSAPTDTDLFVTGYTISISNGGNLFEKGADLFIYDSTCQLAQNVSNTIHFTLKVGFCFIDNVCVQHGAINPKDNCLKCDQLRSTTTWTAASIDGCSNQQSVTKHEDPSNYLWVIGVVAGILVGVVVGVVVVIKLTKNRGKRVSDSSLFEKPR